MSVIITTHKTSSNKMTLVSIIGSPYSGCHFLFSRMNNMRLDGRLQIFLTLFTVLTFTSACSDQAKQSESKNTPVAKMDLLVTTQWLSEHLNDPDLVVLDSTVLIKFDEKGKISSVNGRANYEAGHIPSAGFADLLDELSAQDTSLDFVMPSPEQFRDVMSKLGVGNDSRVVIYSAQNSVWAARLWWMLRWAGFDQAALLDGGLEAWKAEGRSLSTEPSNRPAKPFTLALRPEVVAKRDEVFAAIDKPQVQIIDAMSDGHYKGQFSMYARPGHITSATNTPSSLLMDESGYYKSFDELDMMHEGDRSNRVITYCGGGVAASSVAFIMHRLGYSDVSVYMGSLQEWAVNSENPMTVDVP